MSMLRCQVQVKMGRAGDLGPMATSMDNVDPRAAESRNSLSFEGDLFGRKVETNNAAVQVILQCLCRRSPQERTLQYAPPPPPGPRSDSAFGFSDQFASSGACASQSSQVPCGLKVKVSPGTIPGAHWHCFLWYTAFWNSTDEAFRLACLLAPSSSSCFEAVCFSVVANQQLLVVGCSKQG